MSVSCQYVHYNVIEYTAGRPRVRDRHRDKVRRAEKKRERWATGAPKGGGDRERQAAQVRGVMIARLDEFVLSRLEPLADRYGLEPDEFLRFFQDVQLTLFPEEFADRPPASYAEAGLVPREGRLSHVMGADWFGAFAERLLKEEAARRAKRAAEKKGL